MTVSPEPVRTTVRGATLACTDEGSGETVVLVHGSASDHRAFRRQRAALAAGARVITYSRRYHWPNAPIPDGTAYTTEAHVEDLHALLEARDAAPAHLVGHSYGAVVCLLLAMRAPHLVRTLVLAEPPALTLFVSPEPRVRELVALAVRRPRAAAALVRFGARGVAPARRAFARGDLERGVRIFGDAVFGAGGYDRLPPGRRAQVRDNLTTVRAELLGPGFPELDAHRVAELRMPILLVSGERSLPLFHHVTRRLRELWPHAAHVVLPEAGHAMHADAPEAFNAAVTAFLARSGASLDTVRRPDARQGRAAGGASGVRPREER